MYNLIDITSPLGDGSQGEACPTDSSFVADQDMANIAKTSTLPSDSAPRVTSLAAEEGSMQQKLDELTALCTSLRRQQSEMVAKFEAQELEITGLKAIIKVLEDKDRGVADKYGDDAPIKGRSMDEGDEAAEKGSNDTEEIINVLTSMDAATVISNKSGDDAPIKGRSMDEGEEAAEKGSNDTEEIINVLTSMDAATVISSGVAEVPTGSSSIPPATGVPTGSDVVPTAGLIFATATVVTPYTRRKGKEKTIESETPKKKKIQENMDIQMARQLEEDMERDAQRMNEQIARDAEIARIHEEEELQMMINSLDKSNETVVKYLQEYEHIPEDLSIGERIELISDLVKYQENYAQFLKYQTLPRKPRSKKQKKDYYMAIEDFIPIGSKEETERFKRKGLRLEQVSEKKLKTLKEIPKEVKATEEVPKDKVKELMQLVPIEEVYVEALQVKHPIIDWKEVKATEEVPKDKVKELMQLVPIEEVYVEALQVKHPIIDWKHQVYGRIVRNKMHKAFLLPVMEFPLPGEVPTASEESSHCQKKRDATGEKIALLLKSSSNCQSKSYDSYANSAIFSAVASLFFCKHTSTLLCS
nr:hypothetical protein [Tanacetum cinerariifolium]